MTILLHDAREDLKEKGYDFKDEAGIHELLYADDTLLIDADAHIIAEYMYSIEQCGKHYGLEFNFAKIEALPINCKPDIEDSQSNVIKMQDAIVYFGALIAADGKPTSELSRRLGGAQADFKALAKVWNHTSVRKAEKNKLFYSLVVSKLMYALETVWLSTAERRKLDGMQSRCLRTILGIRHSFYNRVSNKTVRQRCNVIPLSTTLLQRQLQYFGKLARLPSNSVLRATIFAQGSMDLRTSAHRKRGRPRMCWSTEVHKHAVAIAGSSANLQEAIADPVSWKKLVREYTTEFGTEATC